MILFSEPSPPTMNKDCENDPIMLGPVKVVPGEFSCWDKHHIDGPKTIQEIIDFYKTTYDVELFMISAGRIILYNNYEKMEAKMGKTPIEVSEMILNEKFPPW